MDKTSYSHPLRIDAVQPVNGNGWIGMSFCPGKTVIGAFSGGNWRRDLHCDVGVIRQWGASTVVTLLERWELEEMKVPDLGSAIGQSGMNWHWLQIKDGGVPQDEVVPEWRAVKAVLLEQLSHGESIFIHCKGGLGRTGTLATELLVALGEPLPAAMLRVRMARPGAIETSEQELYLLRNARGSVALQADQDGRMESLG